MSKAASDSLRTYAVREDCVDVLARLGLGSGAWEHRCRVKPEWQHMLSEVIVTCNGEIVTVGLIPAAKRQSKPQGFQPA
jgi:hypothetical protein